MCVEELEFPTKIKDIPMFERLNKLKINVFELAGTKLTPVYSNKKYLQPQIDMFMYENTYCPITKMHCLVNKNQHMKLLCRRCLTAFSSIDILNQHTQRIKQQPNKINLFWKDHESSKTTT